MIVRRDGGEGDASEFQICLIICNSIQHAKHEQIRVRISSTYLPFQTPGIEGRDPEPGGIVSGEDVEIVLGAVGRLSLGELVGGIRAQRKSIEESFYGIWRGEP